MPAQHRVRPHQQQEPVKHVSREPVQQGGQECAVTGEGPWPGLAQLPLQDRDLVTQHQDLHLLVPVTHCKQSQ
jgi:hypothetical protein